MNIMCKVKKVLYNYETETVLITSNKEELIRTCNDIDDDYNVTVWIDGKFDNAYLDMEEHEIMELFKNDTTTA